jgi:hypothetical protein
MMNKRKFWLIWISLAGTLIFLLGPDLQGNTVLAHGEAMLTVTPSAIGPGEVITVKGEGVEPDETFTITLEGLNFETILGTVTVGDDEDFHEEYSIPADISPGTYQVRAATPEGEILTAELVVKAGATATEHTASVEPSAALMELERSWPIGQLIVVIAGLIISAGLGLWLLIWAK